jgi:hypothetical protein
MVKLNGRDKRKRALELMIGLTKRDSDYMNHNSDCSYVKMFLSSYTYVVDNGLSRVHLRLLLESLKYIKEKSHNNGLLIVK